MTVIGTNEGNTGAIDGHGFVGPREMTSGIVPGVSRPGRSGRYALGAAIVVGAVAYAFTGRGVLSLVLGGISGGAVGLAQRGREGNLRETFQSLATLRNGVLPSLTSANPVEESKLEATRRGLDLATMPSVGPTSCRMEGAHSVCRTADGAVQCIDGLPEPGSAYFAFAMELQRRLARMGTERQQPNVPPPNQVPAQVDPNVGADRNGRPLVSPEPLVFGSRDGRQ